MAQGPKRRGRIFIYIALILILGVVLVWALVLRPQQKAPAQSAEPTAVSSQEMSSIVVTMQKVAYGTPLTEDVLTTIPYPKNMIVEGVFYTDPKLLIGKKAKMNMDARVPITTSMIADDTSGSQASSKIPPGMVAVSIPISRLSSVSYALQPGDHVNVIATMLFVDVDSSFQSLLPNFTAIVTSPATTASGGPDQITSGIASGGEGSKQGRTENDDTLGRPVYVVPSENQRPRMVSQTVLQDIVILQVGNFDIAGAAAAQPEATPTPAPAGTTTTTSPSAPDVVTLVVTPQDAVTINYLLNNKVSLTLALRGSGDDQRIQTEAVTLQYTLDTYNIPVPAKQSYAIEPRVDTLNAPTIPNDTVTTTPK
jgi:pilus assembly protein CpaB